MNKNFKVYEISKSDINIYVNYYINEYNYCEDRYIIEDVKNNILHYCWNYGGYWLISNNLEASTETFFRVNGLKNFLMKIYKSEYLKEYNYDIVKDSFEQEKLLNKIQTGEYKIIDNKNYDLEILKEKYFKKFKKSIDL